MRLDHAGQNGVVKRGAQLLKETIAGLVQRLDGWTNEYTGAGTSRDRTAYGEFFPRWPLTEVQLSNLYHHDDVAGRAVDLLPKEMLRLPFEVKTKTEDVENEELDSQIVDKLEELGVRDKFRRAMIWGRLFGGAATLIGADDRLSADEPLQPERAKDITFLYTIDKRQLQPYTLYTDVGNPKLGEVETYLLGFEGQADQPMVVIHESRLIMWPGAITGDRERVNNNYWDYSVLQRMYDVLRQFAESWQAVGSMLSEANQNVIKVAGLHDQTAAQGRELVQQRMQVMNLYRSVFGALVLDAGSGNEGEAEESFERFHTNFTGIHEILDKVMLRLSAAVQIPVTILMGQSPAGMNATGDSDFRWFYDTVGTEQENTLTPRVRRLVKTWFKTQAGPVDDVDNLAVKYQPLWTPTPEQEAKRRRDISEADKNYVDMKALRPEHVLKGRFRPEGFNADIVADDEAIEAANERLEAYYENGEDGGSNGMFSTGGGPAVFSPRKVQGQQQGEDPEEAQRRQDAKPEPGETGAGLEQYATPEEPGDVVPLMEGHQRLVVTGPARCGKSVYSARAGERYERKVVHEDSIFKARRVPRDVQAAVVAKDINAAGSWIVEGCSAVLGIRKWLADNPGKPFPATVMWLDQPLMHQSIAHVNQAKGIVTVWRQVLPELEKRGAVIITREKGTEDHGKSTQEGG